MKYPSRQNFRRLTLLGVSALAAMAACVPAGDGVTPPVEINYFPVAVQVDSASKYLVVVNSDFDLQYNQGTIQTLTLSRIRELIRTPCSSDSDCSDDMRCDTEPALENRGEASFFCVDRSGEFAGLPCGVIGASDATTRAVSPGRCGPISLTQPADGGETLVRDVVEISAFATDGRLIKSPDDAPAGAPTERLFVPVRGDSSLHWLDLEDGRLFCGRDRAAADDDALARRCDDAHKLTLAPDFVQVVQPLPEDEDEEQEDLVVAPEPFDLAATEDGRVIAVTHQLGAAVSTFINDWEFDPFLVNRLDVSVENPMGIAAVPRPKVVGELSLDYQAGFLMTNRSQANVFLLRFFDDGAFNRLGEVAEGVPPASDATIRPAMYEADSSPITTNSSGFDSRGIAVDGSQRREAEASCAAGDSACLEAAAAVPLVVYVANRAPNSLLVGTTGSSESSVASDDLPTFHDNIPLTQGPSRVVIGHVTDRNGDKQLRVFVLCFDSALIYIYDPARRLVEAEIYTGRGPHSIAFDGERPLLYVGHFTDSYVGVVSLDQRHLQSYGAMLGTIGVPSPPRAAQ